MDYASFSNTEEYHAEKIYRLVLAEDLGFQNFSDSSNASGYAVALLFLGFSEKKVKTYPRRLFLNCKDADSEFNVLLSALFAQRIVGVRNKNEYITKTPKIAQKFVSDINRMRPHLKGKLRFHGSYFTIETMHVIDPLDYQQWIISDKLADTATFPLAMRKFGVKNVGGGFRREHQASIKRKKINSTPLPPPSTPPTPPPPPSTPPPPPPPPSTPPTPPPSKCSPKMYKRLCDFATCEDITDDLIDADQVRKIIGSDVVTAFLDLYYQKEGLLPRGFRADALQALKHKRG